LAGVSDLLAPDLYPAELAPAITRAERQKRITQAEGAAMLADHLRMMPVLCPTLPDLLPSAYAISSHLRIGVYDCLYVALAEREQCEFITADDKLVRTLQPFFPFILALSSVP
jgi:predicted nucleic acid-binding protein